MTVPPLAVPILLEAITAWQDDQSEARAAQIREALDVLDERLGLRGVRVATDVDLLVPFVAGAGTLRDEATGDGVRLLGPWEDDELGTAWFDGTDAARETAQRALEFTLEAMRAEVRARRAERHLDALDAAVRGISGVLELEKVLQLIVDRVRSLVSAQYAALGIVDEHGDIERFITSGMSHDTRERIGNLPRGRGLLGLIIRESRTYRIPDIAEHPDSFGFPEHHPPMGSFLGVPVIVAGRSVGNFYLTNKIGAPTFGGDDEALVEMFALHAGIALENARLYEAVQRLAIFDERDRISKELHDSIIQSIYGVTLALDDVPDLVKDDPLEARERVDRAVDALHAVTRDIRNFIFGLRPILLQEGGFAEGLEILAREIERNTAVEVDCHVDPLPELPAQVTAELLAMAREALANVARHARATRAWVELRQGDTGLHLVVGDDGVGFVPGGRRAGHHGLANIGARAEALGGRLEVESTPDTGTRIIVTLPSQHTHATEGIQQQ